MQHGNASNSSCQTSAARMRFSCFSQFFHSGDVKHYDLFRNSASASASTRSTKTRTRVARTSRRRTGKAPHNTATHPPHRNTPQHTAVKALLGCVAGLRRWGGRWVALLVCRLLVFMHFTGRHYARFSLGPFGSEKLESSLESSGASV